MAAFLALAALAAVAVFLFTSRSVRLEIEPPPDRLAIEGGLAFELGGFHLLRPGSYTLHAEKPGYRPLEAPLEVTRESRQSVRFALEKLPGRLEVRAAVDGAEVLIDGESRGTTPLAPFEVEPGEREVAVTAERFRDFSTRLVIEGGGAAQTLEVELLPRWAEVTFASEPAGARVVLDGEALGTTPLTAEVLEGGHDFALLLAGRKPHRGRLEVTAGEPRTLPAVALRPSDGNLVLASEPAGATVAVGGAYRGETPLDLYLEPGREHTVSVSKAGYESRAETLSLGAGETRELAVTLEPQEGEVQVSTWPPGAELLVGGEPRGSANQTLRLKAVPQEIEVRHEGFVPHRQTVTPLPGVAQWIEVTLKPLAQARAEARAAATPPVYESPEGHELRLIPPGRLRLGASRREPGRRANEVLREVELTRPFYLATREVSNRQFRRFKSDHVSGQVAGHTLELDHHPAVNLTWEEAAAYCNWLSRLEDLPPAYVEENGKLVAAAPMTTGYRLPTEAEWAWAARYGPGRAGGAPQEASEALKYPWGDTLPVAPGSGNYGDASAQGILPGALSDYDDGFPTTAPADSFEPNARGIQNLGGNVAEWVHDLYAIRMGGAGGVERDPLGPESGDFHVIRGSSWMHSTVTELRLSFRDYGDKARPDVGFRIARYAE